MALQALRKHTTTILYGAGLALLLFLLKWLELRFVILNNALDVYIGAMAVLFTGLGIWLSTKLSKPRVQTVVVEREVTVEVPVGPEFVRNDAEVERLGLRPRELEVLAGMAAGLSNEEIAERLFLSLNTVKTHSSNLFEKLDVKRRTQAVEQARKLGIIA